MINKPVRVFMKDNARKEFEQLNKIVGDQISRDIKNSQEIQLLNSIKQKINFLKENPFYGDNIPKKLIPKDSSVQNLWRIELPNFWRMIYTIKGDEIEINCFVLEIFNHKKYDKFFGY